METRSARPSETRASENKGQGKQGQQGPGKTRASENKGLGKQGPGTVEAI
jgi:hypothetical protein